jgi:DNA-binding transcriptional regulator YiaG
MTPEEILEIRKKLCVTQEKFAALLGTTVVTVNRWENGKAVPSRLYIKELKELRNNHGSYLCRRKEFEDA